MSIDVSNVAPNNAEISVEVEKPVPADFLGHLCRFKKAAIRLMINEEGMRSDIVSALILAAAEDQIFSTRHSRISCISYYILQENEIIISRVYMYIE